MSIAAAVAACSSQDERSGDGANALVPPVAGPAGILPAAGTGGAAGIGGSAGVTAVAGASGAGAGTGAGAGGLGGAGGFAGMAGAAAGMDAAGAGGSAGTIGMVMDGVEPSAITLAAVGANQTVGLDFPRVAGATGYRIRWSMTAGMAATGQMIDVAEPGYVHRALTNGSAYYYVVSSLLPSGEGPQSAEATATPGGEWTLEVLGAGAFLDVSTGERVPQVPLADRIHILLLGDGYLEGELSIFHDHAQHDLDNPENDVDRWIAEVFGIDPYAQLKEAFVVWYLARPSDAHIGEGSTAFGGGDVAMAEVPLFAALDAAGTDAFAFPPTTTTRNFVASFLLFDPARGRAGVSGHTTQCRNPANTNQRIGCAFGVGHAHEFTHAFSNVRDEYMENDNQPPQPSETSNVYPSNACGELPWAHLLEGAGINDMPNLVGAFGRPERGYHSELLCLMNGTHDNGQYWCGPSDDAYTTLTLRPDRLCNWCRELTAYAVMRRTGFLPEMNGFDTWKSTYRMAFFDSFGFYVPDEVPQTLECNRNAAGMPVYEACMP